MRSHPCRDPQRQRVLSQVDDHDANVVKAATRVGFFHDESRRSLRVIVLHHELRSIVVGDGVPHAVAGHDHIPVLVRALELAHFRLGHDKWLEHAVADSARDRENALDAPDAPEHDRAAELLHALALVRTIGFVVRRERCDLARAVYEDRARVACMGHVDAIAPREHRHSGRAVLRALAVRDLQVLDRARSADASREQSQDAEYLLVGAQEALLERSDRVLGERRVADHVLAHGLHAVTTVQRDTVNACVGTQGQVSWLRTWQRHRRHGRQTRRRTTALGHLQSTDA